MYTVTHGHEEKQNLPSITLKGGEHEVRFLPEAGFNCYYWTFLGKEILMEPVDILHYGSKYGIPLLFPTPNRVRDAKYTWKGKTYHQTKRGEPVLLHGLVMTEKWAVTATAYDDHAVCEGTIDILKGNPLYEGYPFPCRLTVTYTLRDDGLHMAIKVQNLGTEEMPFGFAIHPYFSKRGDANNVFITAPVHRAYEMDEKSLPSGILVDMKGTDRDISDGYHSVESLSLDNVFRGMTADMCAQIEFRGEGAARVTLRGDDAYRNLVIFTPHDRPGFCFEHQTCSTDFINLYNNGFIDESGIIILQPEREWTSWIDLTCEAL